MSTHPLTAVLRDAASGRFPAADGRTEVLAPDPAGTWAVVAFTGHAYVLGDVSSDEVDMRETDGEGGGFGGVLAPSVLTWLAGEQHSIGSLDVVLVTDATGGGDAGDASRVAELVPGDPRRDHSRVLRAEQHRAGVRVFGNDHGVVVLGGGLVGRCELSVELFDAEGPAAGSGRSLIAAGLARVPAGEPCWAQVAAGNARSLRAFLAAGFRPICSEVLLTPR